MSTIRGEGRSHSPLRSGFVSPVATFQPTGSSLRNASPAPVNGVGNVAPNGNAFAQQQDAMHAAREQQKTLAALQGHHSASNMSTSSSSGSSKVSVPAAAPQNKAKGLKQRLSLNTQLPGSHPARIPEEKRPGDGPSRPPQPGPKKEEEEDDDLAEVIAMSPAANTAPIVRYRQSRSSLVLNGMQHPNGSQPNVNGSTQRLSIYSGMTSHGRQSSEMDDGKPYFGQNVSSHELVATGLENAFSRMF